MQLGGVNAPFMWYPVPGLRESGSCQGLNFHQQQQQPFWGYPMGYQPQFYPSAFTSLSRPQSPATSVKSARRYKPPSPSPSLKSRRSLVSAKLGRHRRSPDSPLDASSEDSEDSDLDDRLSRSSRTSKRESANRSRNGNYRDDLSRNKRGFVVILILKNLNVILIRLQFLFTLVGVPKIASTKWKKAGSQIISMEVCQEGNLNLTNLIQFLDPILDIWAPTMMGLHPQPDKKAGLRQRVHLMMFQTIEKNRHV